MKPDKKIIISIISSLVVIIVTIIAFNLKSDKLELSSNTWKRELKDDIEIITFNEDRTFSFTTPDKKLKKYDTCTKYKYNERKNTIKLTCDKKVEDMKLIKNTEKELVLKIGNKKYTYTQAEK